MRKLGCNGEMLRYGNGSMDLGTCTTNTTRLGQAGVTRPFP
jgi:hypothetical protein